MSDTKQTGTQGIILITVSSGAEARSILERVFDRDTCLLGNAVYGNDLEGLFEEPIARSMSMDEFFRRFIAKQ